MAGVAGALPPALWMNPQWNDIETYIIGMHVQQMGETAKDM